MDAKPKRRWYQFSLRTMFVLVLVVSIPLAWVGYSLSWIRQRHEALKARLVYDSSGSACATAPGGLWLLIVRVTVSVVLGYREYFPASFESDFLRGRESYFTGHYQWAFYSHILCGPCSLILGLMMMSESFRIRFPKWHRRLGKMQIALVVLVLGPSGLWMAPYAETGFVAALGFSGLALATECCALVGWRSAVNRRFAAHRLWMQRCFLLLCSAVVLRLIGGLASVTLVGVTWSYPLAAWASWVVPLALFELGGAVHRAQNTRGIIGADQNSPSAAALSLPEIDINAQRRVAGVSADRN